MAEIEIIRAFSDASLSYEQNASVQRDCALDLMDMLLLYSDAEAPTPASVLDIGCGTGLLTRMLAERFPCARIMACDPSHKMLKEAKRLMLRLHATEETGMLRHQDTEETRAPEFIRCDVENLPDERWDLIASNAVLHWAGSPERVLADLKNHLSPSGTLAFSYFTQNTYAELTEALSQAAGFDVKLPSADFASADELEISLSRQFVDVRTQRKIYYRDFADLRALLENIKLTGTRGAGSTPKLRWTKKLLENTEQEYLARNGRIRASYEVVLCTAKNPSI